MITVPKTMWCTGRYFVCDILYRIRFFIEMKKSSQSLGPCCIWGTIKHIYANLYFIPYSNHHNYDRKHSLLSSLNEFQSGI